TFSMPSTGPDYKRPSVRRRSHVLYVELVDDLGDVGNGRSQLLGLVADHRIINRTFQRQAAVFGVIFDPSVGQLVGNKNGLVVTLNGVVNVAGDGLRIVLI